MKTVKATMIPTCDVCGTQDWKDEDIAVVPSHLIETENADITTTKLFTDAEKKFYCGGCGQVKMFKGQPIGVLNTLNERNAQQDLMRQEDRLKKLQADERAHAEQLVATRTQLEATKKRRDELTKVLTEGQKKKGK